MSPRLKEASQKVREETKKKIERSAVTLFARQGLSVTVSQIASNAGVSQGLLYQHYKSKDALIEELIEKAMFLSNTFIEKMFELPISPKDKINLISQAMLEMFSMPDDEGTKMFLFMIQAGMNAPKTDLSESNVSEYSKTVEYLIEIILAGQADGTVKQGNPVSLALAYWATVQGFCCFSLTGMPIPKEIEPLSNILLK